MTNFIAGKVYVNRYRDEYHFEKVSENLYKFVMEGESMRWCRFGGKENIPGIDNNDLGMVDPSGGPYMSVGEMKIDDREVIKISSGDCIKLEVK